MPPVAPRSSVMVRRCCCVHVIRGPSATPRASSKAPLDGKVVRSRCSGALAGLVLSESGGTTLASTRALARVVSLRLVADGPAWDCRWLVVAVAGADGGCDEAMRCRAKTF